MRIPTLLLLTACQGASLPAELLPPGAQSMTLSGPTGAIAGEVVTLTVTSPSLTPGNVIQFGLGSRLGSGTCPYRAQTTGSPCLNIVGGVRLLGEAAVVDVAGTPTAELSVVVAAPTSSVFIQAFHLSGGSSSTSTTHEIALEQPWSALAPRVDALEQSQADHDALLTAFSTAGDAISVQITDLQNADLDHDAAIGSLAAEDLDLALAISNLQSAVLDHNGGISDLYNADIGHAAAIGDLVAADIAQGLAISNLQSAVLDHNGDISDLYIDLGTANTAHSTLAGTVTSQANDITTLQAQVTALQGLVAAAAGLFSGRMVYYPFDDAVGSYTYDVSGYGQTAELRGGSNFVSTTRDDGRAMDFNGTNGHLLIADHPAQRSYFRGLTLMAWARPVAAQAGMIVSKHFTNGSRAWDISVTADQGFQFGISDDTTWTGSSGNTPYYITTVGSLVPLNTWTHVAGTWDRATGLMTTYVNGAAVQTLSVPANMGLNNTTVPMMVGAYNDNSTGSAPRHFFRGQIDEVMVYNRPLTATEIASYYAITQ